MPRKTQWSIDPYKSWDKQIIIHYNDGEFIAYVDHDDVDTKRVEKMTIKMIKLLNKHWNDDLKKKALKEWNEKYGPTFSVDPDDGV